MAAIVLPLFDANALVGDAVRAMRTNRVSAVISTAGGRFWVHRFEDLADSARRDPTAPLIQVNREDVPELEPSEAAANNLSFTQPNQAIIGRYIATRQHELMITATAPASNVRVMGPRIAVLVTMSTAVAQNFSVYPKAWVCPNDSAEVWDDTNKPSNGQCPRHGVALVEDK